MRYEPLTKGTTFGRWTVTEDQRQFAVTVNVICDCGTTRTMKVQDLRHGQSRSCGCLRREVSSQLALARQKNPLEIGARYGRLTVKSYRMLKEVTCQCDCGNTVIVTGHKLRTGSTKSCGCLRRESLANVIRKYSDETNAAIIADVTAGMSQAAAARKYNASPSHVWSLVHNKYWKQ